MLQGLLGTVAVRFARLNLAVHCLIFRRRSRVSLMTSQFLKELGLGDDNAGCYNGNWTGSGEHTNAVCPSTGMVIARVRQGNESDYEACVVAMEQAKKAWAEVSADECICQREQRLACVWYGCKTGLNAAETSRGRIGVRALAYTPKLPAGR